MKVTEFDFHLPDSLIAKDPHIPRDACRLLILHRDTTDIEHRKFYDLPEFLSRGDLLLLNNTKVLPARLSGSKQTGGKIQLLLVKELEPNVWEVLSRGSYTGRVLISGGLSGEMRAGKIIRFDVDEGDCSDYLWRVGEMPLPPYIKRMPSDADKQWYQTVYADEIGSIAAPTAGLHFSRELLGTLESKGVLISFLTLHIGTGTFKPVTAQDVEDHVMDREHFEIRRDVIETVKRVKQAGKRVIAVGTTATRAIEGFMSGRWRQTVSDVSRNGSLRGTTDIFIYPGYRFRVLDSLVTNFHLPRSTPFMLTSAFCGTEKLLGAYRDAVSEGYRFFSYGDAMLIL
ncbi:MAG TPA: tRNA preQ1(34) S-adenosylmethionine ribosyltransferase-isomerase QueA [Nitrospiraceae bacterium]|nr:tRNA preQ1(34) S-adenosylmethionine ribosyltransferase-isomerase QueA [Nitrospiraceae bacterium]